MTRAGAGPVSERVGANVRRYRTDRRMSLRRLRELLADVGLDVSISALSRVDLGQVAVSVDELAQLAEALDVAPADLLEEPVTATEAPAVSMRLGAHDQAPDAVQAVLSPDVLRMLAGIALITPETQAMVERIAAAGAAGAKAAVDEHIWPLIEAFAAAHAPLGVSHGDASE